MVEPPAMSTSYLRMQEQGLFRDPLPKVTPSGKSTTIADDSVKKNLESDIHFPLPLTPRELQKYRRNYKPGEINVHPGLQGQKLPPKDFRLGCQTNAGVSAAATLAAGKKEGIAEYMQMRGESIYASTKRQPLGASMERGYNWPAQSQDSDFAFGKADEEVMKEMKESKSKSTLGCAGNSIVQRMKECKSKEVLFPSDAKPDSEETRQQYIKTHGTTAPGEMADRKYNWPVNRNEFAFGVTDKKAGDSVKAALSMDRAPGPNKLGYPQTRIVPGRIVPLTSESYRQVNNDPVGLTRNRSQGAQPLPPGHTYGVNKDTGSDSTVSDCLRGWYSLKEQLPDADLGKSTYIGKRNVSDTGRSFGVPSIRADIPGPERRSVADAQNYGDEAGSAALLHPQRFELMGIPDEEFLLRRPREEVESILQCAGMDTSKFGEIWEAAVGLFEDGKATASLDAYLFIQSRIVDEDILQKHKALPQAA